MSFVRKSVLASIVFATALGVAGHANAAKLFKGIAVITGRSDTPECVLEFDIHESFVVEYVANLAGESTPERLSIIGSNGALLLTNADATPTLRGAGRVSISGNIFATPVVVPTTISSFSIPAVVNTTVYLNLTGTAHNVAFPGCSVTFRAALTALPPGGY
jgi:hypothetical protein